MTNQRPLKRIVIKEELVALTGNYIDAILLNQFLYWSQHVNDFDVFLTEEATRMEDMGQTANVDLRNGWIYKKAEELSEETMLRLSKSNMMNHITKLIEAGWIEQRRNPKNKMDKTFQYRLNLIQIQRDLLSIGYNLDGYPLPWTVPSIPPTEPRNSTSELRSSKTELANLQGNSGELRSSKTELRSFEIEPRGSKTEQQYQRLLTEIKDDAYSAHTHAKENISNLLQNIKPALGDFQESQTLTSQAAIVTDQNFSTQGNLALAISSIVDIPSDGAEPNPAYQAIETLATSLLQRPMLNALELNMIDDLLESGVAVETILQGIQESFELYQPKFSRDRIRSLQYCEPRIWELHEHKQHVPQKIEHEAVLSDVRSVRSSRSNGNWSQRPSYDFSQNICQPQAGKYERFYQVFGHATDKPGVYEKE